VAFEVKIRNWKMLDEELQGKRARCRWEANIKVDLRKTGCECEEVTLMARNILFYIF
jgi:hypothetical protein